MAAAMARAGVTAGLQSSLLMSCNLPICKNLCVRTGVLWKQPPSRTFVNGRKKFHTAPVGQVFRLRPFHILVATGGGYAGYKKYEDYKLEQLEKRGIEVPVKLASEWEVTESKNIRDRKGPQKIIQSNPPARAGSPRPSRTGTRPGGFSQTVFL